MTTAGTLDHCTLSGQTPPMRALALRQPLASPVPGSARPSAGRFPEVHDSDGCHHYSVAAGFDQHLESLGLPASQHQNRITNAT